MRTGRPEPAMLEGLSRFLILHERCGAGFDVAHPAGVGSGRVSITCRGCGARHEYLTTTIEIEREVQFEVKRAEDAIPALTGSAAAEGLVAAPVEEDVVDSSGDVAEPLAAGGPAAPSSPPPSFPTADEGKPPPPSKPPQSDSRTGGITGARAGTIALLLVAVIAVVVAVVRLSDGSDEQASPTTTAVQTATTPTTTTEQPTTEQPTTPTPQPGQPELREVTTPTYSLSVPADWETNSEGPALSVAPPEGDDVGLRIYSDERPDLSLTEMARLSGQLLLNEHPGSSLSPIHATTVGGIDAATVGVDFDGGSETAFAIARGSVRYLLLVSVRSSASAAERRQTAAAVASFRPA